jgi:hypothetical protein
MQARNSENLIIVGTAKNVWQEFLQAKAIFGQHDTMCINFSLLGFDDLRLKGMEAVHHWSTLHPEIFALRVTRPPLITHSRTQKDLVDMAWPEISDAGTSSLFSLQVGMKLGYKKIIVVGIPLNREPRFTDFPGAEMVYDDTAIHMSWSMFLNESPESAKIVRSTSGKTMELYGAPTQEWANG